MGRVNPAMLALARECRGWTQTQLAGAIGVSVALVCRYELGDRPVGDEHFAKLVTVLGFDESFFGLDFAPVGSSSSVVFHRKRAALSPRVLKRVYALVNVKRAQLLQLLRLVDVEAVTVFPKLPSDALDDDVPRVAREVRRLWGMPDGPVQCLTRHIERAGGVVGLCDFGTKMIDGVHIWPGGEPPQFYMNELMPPDRHRWSLAHEVGHAVMHTAFSPTSDPEDEADAFAAELLLPRALVRFDLRGLTIDAAYRLAAVWGVSAKAIIVRAKELGLLNDAKYRRLLTMNNAKASRQKDSLGVPESFKGQHEPAGLVTSMIDTCRTQLGIGDERLRRLLFTDNLSALPSPDEPDERAQLRLAF